MDLKEVFDTFENESHKFERIENPPSKRPDLCAFLLLDKLVPGKFDIVSAAEHDEIYLDCDVNKLAEKATEADVVYLVRCGVWYDSETDSLAMFV
ncbi:MAG: hypothetical protein Q7R33_02860 [Nitrosarchaeum sp.]|nr:hypothetical protein [Nitrosarchaeum sp.]